MADPLAKCSNGYCAVPDGTFTMGSPKGVGFDNERPQREVTMSAYQLRQTEVTIGEYRAFLAKRPDAELNVVLSGCSSLQPDRIVVKGKPGETEQALLKRAQEIAGKANCAQPTKVERQPKAGIPMQGYCSKVNGKSDDHPVVCIFPDEAEAFCQSENATLPTAAQIEYASKRGGATPNVVVYENSNNSTASVVGSEAERRRNGLGIQDLEGNVWERTKDRYEHDFYSRMSVTDPYNPVTDLSQAREFRGGSFNSGARGARPANRGSGNPGSRGSVGGFRCARPLPQDSTK